MIRLCLPILWDLVSENTTKGLRFSDSSFLEIPHANEYESFMKEKAQIEVDFNKRKEIIREQVTSVAKSIVMLKLLLMNRC